MADRDLDAWFAKADDVLRTWDGSPDAMSARGEADDADPELPLLGDNRADQTWPLPRRRGEPLPSRPARVRARLLAAVRHGQAQAGTLKKAFIPGRSDR